MTGALGRMLGRAADVRKGETAALVWSFSYFFLILTAYYILRPIRDALGAEKLYIGGRTAAGEEKFFKLGVVRRVRSGELQKLISHTSFAVST